MSDVNIIAIRFDEVRIIFKLHAWSSIKIRSGEEAGDQSNIISQQTQILASRF